LAERCVTAFERDKLMRARAIVITAMVGPDHELDRETECSSPTYPTVQSPVSSGHMDQDHADRISVWKSVHHKIIDHSGMLHKTLAAELVELREPPVALSA
jgi:hypothetical protein